MTKPSESVWDRRENNFDFLRLALAVLVIFSHSYPLGSGSEASEPFVRWTHGQLTGGAIAVDIFFIMSGFLIAASAERSQGVLAFMKKRVSRIYPAFVVAALLCVIYVLPLAGGNMVQSSVVGRVGNFVVQTLRLQEFTYTGAFQANPYPNAINGSVWSIQFEFWCYLGVALLMMLGVLRKRAVVLLVFAAALVGSVALQISGVAAKGGVLAGVFGSAALWQRLMPLYLAGIVFYLFRKQIPLKVEIAAASLAAFILAAFVPHGYTLLFPLAGTYLAFFAAFTPHIRLHRFGRFGDFSYGAYLYAFPIEQLLMHSFGKMLSPWMLFVCATPLTLLAAVASWYGIERRFLRPARRKETVVHALELERQSA